MLCLSHIFKACLVGLLLISCAAYSHYIFSVEESRDEQKYRNSVEEFARLKNDPFGELAWKYPEPIHHSMALESVTGLQTDSGRLSPGTELVPGCTITQEGTGKVAPETIEEKSSTLQVPVLFTQVIPSRSPSKNSTEHGPKISVENHLVRVRRLFESGHEIQALYEVSKAIEYNVNDVAAYTLRASILLDSGLPESAKTDIEAGLKRDPSNVSLLCLQAKALFVLD